MQSATFTKHIACNFCGSSDARALYNDGHSFCFACDAANAWQGRKQPKKESTMPTIKQDTLANAKAHRGLTEESLAFYNVKETQVGDVVFPYNNATKFRTKEKEFSWKGYNKTVGLFGQQNFQEKGLKTIIVTEGEYDAIAAFQMLACTVACVSVENGASGALDAFKRAYKFLDTFDKIIVCFDGDDPGERAASECVTVFPHKSYKMSMKKYKDANEYVEKGATSAWIEEYKGAVKYKPEAIIQLKDVLETLMQDDKSGLAWAFPSLTKLTHGRHESYLYAFGAGVGIGKTDIFTQSIAYDLEVLKQPVGVFYLEQTMKETFLRVAGKIDQKKYHIEPKKEVYYEAFKRLADKPLYLFNATQDGKEWETIKKHIIFLAKACDVKLFYLDHLTALVSGFNKDERRELDFIMADMAGLAVNLNIIIHFISHLTTPTHGASHEEGARVRERDFTGSRAICRWSHYMFGIEGNKNAADKAKRNMRKFTILKDRATGQAAGEFFGLSYDPETGMLSECEWIEEEHNEIL